MPRRGTASPSPVPLIALAVFVLGSPAAALDPSRALTQYQLDVWTPRQGAPAGTIRQIAQTPDGYLWLATNSEGLVRFDGVRFVRMKDLDALLDRDDYSVFSVYVARDGTLWVGTHWGLARQVNGRWETRFKGSAVGGIHETSDGTLRFVAGFEGLGSIEKGVVRRYANPKGCLTAAPGAAGVSWFGCTDGLHRLGDRDLIRLTTEDGIPGNRVNALAVGHGGRVWMGTRGGIGLLVGGRVAASIGASEGLPTDDIAAIYEDRAGSVWVGTTSFGLLRLRRGRLHREAVEVFPETAGLPSSAVTSFLEDREGSLWVGTKGGLCRLRSAAITPFGRPEGLPHDKATSMVEGRDGSVWIWTDGGGLAHVRGRRVEVFTRQHGLASLFGGPLYQARDGALWIGHDPGVSRFAGGRAQVFRSGDLGRHYVSAITEDENGLLVFLVGSGLYYLRDGRLVPHALHGNPLLEEGNPNEFLHARDGTLWMATSDGLLALKDGRLRLVWRVPLEGSIVVALHEDAEGTLWVGTWLGLLRVAGGKVARLTTREGLTQERIYRVLEDRQGNLWLSGPRGIERAAKKDLAAVAEGRAKTVQTRSFGVVDGMRSPEAISDAQPAGCATRDGHLWFATTAGAVVVDPQDVRRNTLPPPVVIERLVDHEREYGGPGPLRLPAGSERLEIHYSGLSLLAPEKVLFRYRLLGLDSRWVEAGTRRTAFYTRLGPGDYTFHVLAANNDGVWNEEGATLAFRIEPYWHQTRAFFLLAFTLVVLAVLGAFRLRMRGLRARERVLAARVAQRTQELERETVDHRITAEQLAVALRAVEQERRRVEEINQAQSRFFANISHELRTPLTLILAPVEALLLENPAGPLGETLQGVLRNSERLARHIDELLDLARLDAGVLHLNVMPLDLRLLASSACELSQPLARAAGVELSLDAPTPTADVFGDPHRIDSILTNLIGNALKFTPGGGRVVVRVRDEGEQATVAVADNGRGIPEADLPMVFDRFFQGVAGRAQGATGGVGIGLALAKDLALLHGGRLEVESRAGAGATFTLSLPKGSAHFRPEAVERRRALEPPTLQTEDPLAGRGTRAAAPRERQAPVPTAAVAAGRPRVLVVEDGEDMRAFLRGLLSPTYDVLEAADGEEGLASVRNDHPDVVISDVMMPERSGTELCRLLKSDPHLRTIPVILLTARAGSEATLEGYAHGADDFVAKPFHPRVLLARIDAQIRLRRLALKLLGQEKLAAVGTLAAGVAHEVRNPLNALANAARVLAQGTADAPLSDELLGIIVEAARRIEEIVAALDSHARPAEGGGVAPCDVAAGLDATLTLLRHRLEGVDVRRNYRTRRRAIAQAGRLNQVFTNLLDNALRAGAKTIDVSVDEDDDGARLRVRVADDGSGVPEEIALRIFDPFFTTRPPGEGTGLGLHLSRQAIMDMGGSLALLRTGATGAAFEILLPAEGRDRPPTAEPVQKP